MGPAGRSRGSRTARTGRGVVRAGEPAGGCGDGGAARGVGDDGASGVGAAAGAAEGAVRDTGGGRSACAACSLARVRSSITPRPPRHSRQSRRPRKVRSPSSSRPQKTQDSRGLASTTRSPSTETSTASPSRIPRLRRMLAGMTTRPRSSTLRRIPLDATRTLLVDRRLRKDGAAGGQPTERGCGPSDPGRGNLHGRTVRGPDSARGPVQPPRHLGRRDGRRGVEPARCRARAG
jgi:hypothetical protein